ncbi:MAG: IPT/TIG domain-containing protein, partial [Patescibacteria group bacterium]
MTAQGNEEQVTKAKTMMTQAVIGLVIIMSSFAIAQFAIRAISGGTGVGSETTPANVGCSTPPCDVGGGSGGLRVSGMTPVGPGPGDQGWPKEYAVTVGFTAAIAPSSVTDASVVVKKCSARPHSLADAAGNCTTSVAIDHPADGSRIVINPKPASDGATPVWEINTWYFVQVVGGSITNATGGKSLRCPLPNANEDLSSPSARPSLCERAVFIGDRSDTAAPTSTITIPHDGASLCAASESTLAATEVQAADDFLVSRIDYRIDSAAAGLTDSSGAAQTAPVSVINGTNAVPTFTTGDIWIKPSALSVGHHTLAAKAFDGALRSNEGSAGFTVRIHTCCDGVMNGGETSIDAGGSCGGGAGATCSSNADCAAGLTCSQGHCVALPEIDNITPNSGGPGTLVTISGKNFGTPGRVTFLGGAGADDDKVAQTCAPTAWREVTPGNFEVIVAVPAGAVFGPIKLETNSGTAATSTMSFTVNSTVRPGICTLDPDLGSGGAVVAANGSGFGAEKGTSELLVGTNVANIALGGWGAGQVKFVVPSIREGEYPVKLSIVDGTDVQETNFVDFTVRSGEEQPHITEVNPAQGGVGTFVTILGTGFGSSPGTVRFRRGTDTIVADMPA